MQKSKILVIWIWSLGFVWSLGFGHWDLPAEAATLYKIRAGYYPKVIRIAFDFDSVFNYQTEVLSDKIIIRLPAAEAGPNIPNYFEINDLALKYLEVEKEAEGLKITIPLAGQALPEPIGYRIFHLNDPPRLVADFGKEFTNILSGGTVAPGVEYLKIKQRINERFITAQVLKIDPQKAEVFPALAKEPEAGPIEAFVSFLNPWKKEKIRRFYKDKVSSIVSQNQGLAGINGTFFAAAGCPLGTLMVSKKLLSSPIYDRTALILTEEKKAYIDNVMVDSYFKLPPGIKFKISGINQGRRGVDTILYASLWGERTGTNTAGIELAVENEKVTAINVNNSSIPVEGYVLSISGPPVEFLSQNVKVGDRLEVSINVIPFSTDPQKILHIISGGPRLLKAGQIYISKYEEHFRADVAKGRAARSAAAITKDGDLLLATVDGLPRGKKQKDKEESSGASLVELASLLLKVGATEAVNLDGGSSTTMVIKNQVANKPTAGFQRRVSNAIVVRE